MTAPELKPCPFCGGRAVGNENAGNPYVYCESCDVSQTPFDRLTASVTAWNRRADLHDATKAQLAKAVEALRPFANESVAALPHHKFVTVDKLICDTARALLAEIEKGEPK